MENETDLRVAFEAAFYAQSSHGWNSERGRAFWSSLEGWRDSIAGPVYSIVMKGDCEYVYTRGGHYFTGVSEPKSLQSRLLDWQAELVDTVEEFTPASSAEEEDLASMRLRAAAMRSVIDRAIEVESRRWQNRPA